MMWFYLDFEDLVLSVIEHRMTELEAEEIARSRTWDY